MGSVTEKSWRVNVLGFNEFNLTKSEVSCLYSKNYVVDVQTLSQGPGAGAAPDAGLPSLTCGAKGSAGPATRGRCEDQGNSA